MQFQLADSERGNLCDARHGRFVGKLPREGVDEFVSGLAAILRPRPLQADERMKEWVAIHAGLAASVELVRCPAPGRR